MSQDNSAPLEPGWQNVLDSEFTRDYMTQLRQFLKQQKDQRKVIYPHSADWFSAFNAAPFDRVRVVILGQDPYHGPGQAHGLCFSVRQGVAPPPSLKNIFKELHRDLDIPPPAHGCLQSWADQGVLLLNSTLTVERGRAGSHQGQGWETFTDQAIRVLEQQREGLVFLLWGSYAQKKGQFIDGKRHLVLKSVHPSPLSAHRGFIGCGHFSRTNQWLQDRGEPAIDWRL